MLDAIVVGAGFAGSTHWIPAIMESDQWRLVGVVDIDPARLDKVSTMLPEGCWTATSVLHIPGQTLLDTIVWVVTPDHLPVIRDLVQMGFSRLVVEKPLVARDHELEEFADIVRANRLQIYCLDHYLQKVLSLFLALGVVAADDPRARLIEVTGSHQLEGLAGSLGEIEGASVINVEADDLGIPYLNQHAWLEHDPEIGGIIRDLGPHIFAPLVGGGLLGPDAKIHDVGLARLSSDRSSFQPVARRSEIEMWVSALFDDRGRSVNVSFGKVPMRGGERSLTVRGEHGFYFLGLPRNRDAVLMLNDGRTTRLRLTTSTNEAATTEAALFFDGCLPADFNGHYLTARQAILFGQRIRQAYFASRQ